MSEIEAAVERRYLLGLEAAKDIAASVQIRGIGGEHFIDLGVQGCPRHSSFDHRGT
jgi:hypothetical protein